MPPIAGSSQHIVKLQREKETLEMKLSLLLSKAHKHPQDIANLQQLISQYEDKISTASTSHRQQSMKELKTIPPIAPEPPPRRSDLYQSQQREVQLHYLGQIDENFHQSNGEKNRPDSPSYSSSSSSSSDIEAISSNSCRKKVNKYLYCFYNINVAQSEIQRTHVALDKGMC